MPRLSDPRPADPRPAPEDAGRSSILLGLEVLMIEAVDGPRRLDEVSTALERVRWVADPVVLAPDTLFGRALPATPEPRAELVRHLLDDPDLTVADAIAEEADRSSAPAVEAWRDLARHHRAEWLITGRDSTIAPARRAGLRVVLVGARGTAPRATVEPAEHSARDLLDAVAHILAAETFAAGAVG